ncbi:MAG: multidrug effflux MFS transporter [Thermomicrobiales bacterium]
MRPSPRTDHVPGMRRPQFALLALLLAFSSLSTDLYLPAMPTMAETLNAGHGTLELSVSGFLLGFALGQLLWGALSDRVGRRLPLVAGLLIFIAGSAGCALAESAGQLIAFRLIQAIGASASVVVARAMVRDLFDRDEAARMLSILTAIMVIAPMVAPTIGAQILHLGSWRAIFGLLAVLGVGTLASLLTIMPETLPADRRDRRALISIQASYLDLVRHRRFMSYALASAFVSAGLFAYVAGSSFAFIDHYHRSPEVFAGIFAMNSLGVISANLVNARLVSRLGSDRLLRIGAGAAAVSSLLVFASAWGYLGAVALAASLFTFTTSSGFIMANAISGGMAVSPKGVGAASAVLGCMQYGGGFIGATLLGVSANGTLLPLGIVMAIGGIGAAIATRWNRPHPSA